MNLYIYIYHMHIFTNVYIYIQRERYIVLLCVCVSMSMFAHPSHLPGTSCCFLRVRGGATKALAPGASISSDSHMSMDWSKSKGTSTGNHDFYHQIQGFPINCPLNQSIEYGGVLKWRSPNWKNRLKQVIQGYPGLRKPPFIPYSNVLTVLNGELLRVYQ